MPYKQLLLPPLLTIILAYLIYWPGINGPFLFDDITSITSNSTLAITALNTDELSRAAQSGYAGPLKRPVALLSFALNYYFANGYHADAFKATNIVIHGFNALLLYILSIQLLKLLPYENRTKQITMAACISTIWLLHPINLTSVLYVVQRMTSLSTLFSLSCISLYIASRNRGIIFKKADWQCKSLLTLSLCSLILALFSKENAILIPLIILLIELTLFPKHMPWRHFIELTSAQKKSVWLMVLCLATTSLILAIDYAEGGFKSRPFSMAERVLTEARVICFYIFQIIIPRINSFGLFHDDIILSTNLASPWTTTPSIFFILSLIISAIYYRIKNPLYSLGIGWFFIGHLLESTIFPLEIAHEHRNNLPSIGIILAIASLTLKVKISHTKAIVSFIFISLILGGTTWLRSKQWSSMYSQAYFETVHHPNSPAAQSIFANAAHKSGDNLEAISAIKKAMQLNKNEIAFALYHQHILATSKRQISEEIQLKTLERIKRSRITPSTELALEQIAECLSLEVCKSLRLNYIQWINIIIEKKPSTAYFHLFKGKAVLSIGDDLKAINIFQKSYELDEKFIHPLFEMIDILLKKGDIIHAEKVLVWIKQANQKSQISRNFEIKQLEKAINTLKKQLKNMELNTSPT